MSERKHGNESSAYKVLYLGFYALCCVVVAEEVIPAIVPDNLFRSSSWDTLDEVTSYYQQHDPAFFEPYIEYRGKEAIVTFDSPNVFEGQPTVFQLDCDNNTLYTFTISQDGKYDYTVGDPACIDGVIDFRDDLEARDDLHIYAASP